MSFIPFTGIFVASDATSKSPFADDPFKISIGTRRGGFVSDRDSFSVFIFIVIPRRGNFGGG